MKLLQQALDDGRFQNKFTFLASHYPLLDKNGVDYIVKHPFHGVANGHALQVVLNKVRKLPSVMIHGHVHHGYVTALASAAGSKTANAVAMQIINPGSAGYRRGAAFNVYDVAGPAEAKLTRYLHNGEDFVEETPGPYQSSG